jgi:hypothetical protein
MKNLLIYYFSILLPMPVLVWSVFYDSKLFVFILLSYFIYRGFTDSKRLVDKGIIMKKEIWKVFIPFYSSYFFKELYFEK